MNKRTTETREPAEYSVWVGTSERIASFHAVETYQIQTFSCHELFLKYLRALQECGFRFQ